MLPGTYVPGIVFVCTTEHPIHRRHNYIPFHSTMMKKAVATTFPTVSAFIIVALLNERSVAFSLIRVPKTTIRVPYQKIKIISRFQQRQNYYPDHHRRRRRRLLNSHFRFERRSTTEDQEAFLHMEPCPDSMENSSLPISDWTLEGEEIIQGDNCLLVYDDSTDSDKENPPETATYSITNSDDTKSPNYLPYDEDASEMELIMDKVLRFTPFFLPALAYCLYDPTASIFASAIDFLSSNNWVAVDGGAYQAQIIAPAINGVVVSCKCRQAGRQNRQDC
jgi:hypothetical protein